MVFALNSPEESNANNFEDFRLAANDAAPVTAFFTTNGNDVTLHASPTAEVSRIRHHTNVMNAPYSLMSQR